jgi:hypothetical protein|tara:strand:+ start:3885 stop:3998 length:114 start_codon:yes stop_codon:yes gene_type:complete
MFAGRSAVGDQPGRRAAPNGADILRDAFIFVKKIDKQ